MKKSIILGGVLISSLAFAKGGYNNNNMDQGEQNNQGNRQGKFNQLSQEQLEKLQTLRLENFKEHQEERLNLEGKYLEIEKLLAEDKVNWKSVEKLTEDAVEIENSLEVAMLKAHEEMKELLGDKVPMFGMAKGNQEQGMRDKQENRRGNQNSQGQMGRQDSEKANDRFKDNKGERNNKNQFKEGNGVNKQRGFGNYFDLSDEQAKKVATIFSDNRTANDKIEIDLALNRNEVEKLLIADEVDWAAVEKKISESTDLKVEIKLNNYKAREAVEDITGRESIRLRRGNMGNKSGMGRKF